MGVASHWFRAHHAEALMAEYLGVPVEIASNDPEHLAFLKAAGEGNLALQRCVSCARLRYPVANACPFCTSLESEWSTVSGRGVIYSYEVVTQAIHPAYRVRTPYPLVLVEMDEQRQFPGPDDGLRVLGTLIGTDGLPEAEERVAIGLRVRVQFVALGDGLALPAFSLTDEPPEAEPWRLGDPVPPSRK